MKQEKFTRSEIIAAISEMNKNLEKTDQQIASLGEKMESIDKIVESRLAKKKNYRNEQKRLEKEKDLQQIKTLRDLCSKANVSMQDIFNAAFAALAEKVANESNTETQEVQREAQATEKAAEDFNLGESSTATGDVEQKNEDGQSGAISNNIGSRFHESTENDNHLTRGGEAPLRKKDKEKPMTPLDKAKIERDERLAKGQIKFPPRQPPPKNSLEERLRPYSGR